MQCNYSLLVINKQTVITLHVNTKKWTLARFFCARYLLYLLGVSFGGNLNSVVSAVKLLTNQPWGKSGHLAN